MNSLRGNDAFRIVAQPVHLGDNENILHQVLDGNLIVVESINSSYGLILRDPTNTGRGLLLADHNNESDTTDK